MGDGILARIKTGFHELFETLRNRIWAFRSRSVLLNLWGHGFRLGLLTYIVFGILDGQFEVGFLVLFMGYFNKIWGSVNELAEVSQDFLVACFRIDRFLSILEEPITIHDETEKQPFPAEWQELRVRDLSFAYGKRSVFKQLAFSVKKGEKVGIVGASGGGKSTLFKLLLKEREDYMGTIEIDDVPIRDIAPSNFVKHTAVVLQDTEVFNLSLRDNIRLANEREWTNEALLERATRVAHVRDFLNRLPNGLDTLVGEKGVRLSGGEKQRLGIARAVFKQPELLFLDEATSHLDVESEGKIRDSLDQFFQSVTAIVIAHRLSTIRQMDRILVLEKGQIIEDGSFDTLFRKKGRFRELWDKQRF